MAIRFCSPNLRRRLFSEASSLNEMTQEPRPKAAFYRSDELTKYKMLSNIVAGKDLASAAEYIRNIFASNRLEFAFLGSYSMKLRGNGRSTSHLDIGAETKMRDLRETLIIQKRVIIPAEPASGIMRIFIRNVRLDGILQADGRCVQANIILSGQLGVPNKLAEGTEIITPETRKGRQMSFPVLNLPNTLKNKLATFQNRDSKKDFEDILWLLSRYRDEIPKIREQLEDGLRLYWLAAFAYHSIFYGRVHLLLEYGRVLGVLGA